MPGGRAQATFDGTILSVNEPNMYVPPSMNAFGVDGNATATITFDAPVNVVSGVARGSGPDTSRPTVGVGRRTDPSPSAPDRPPSTPGDVAR